MAILIAFKKEEIVRTSQKMLAGARSNETSNSKMNKNWHTATSAPKDLLK